MPIVPVEFIKNGWKMMVMPRWECEACNRELESKLEPERCPCGSETIKPNEQLSLLEQMMKDYLNRDDDKRAKS